MSARGHGPPSYESRSTQPAPQSTELERLVSDNKRLAGSHVALRQDLVTTQQDIQKLRAHIGSIQTESDVQIRIFLDKMAKMEVHIRAGENVKKDFQKAHTEARALVASRDELIGQAEQASQELEKVRADVEKLPEMEAELDGLKQEHQKLRLTFEHEKGKNMEKVAQMEVMEKDLVGMAREVERLRAEVSDAEKRANAPKVYAGPYMNQEQYPLPPHMHASNGCNVDGYGNHGHVQMGAGEGMIPYGDPNPRPTVPDGNPQWRPPPQMIPYGGPHPGSLPVGGNPQWRPPPSPYDPQWRPPPSPYDPQWRPPPSPYDSQWRPPPLLYDPKWRPPPPPYEGPQMNLKGPVRNRKKGPLRQEKRESNSIIISVTNSPQKKPTEAKKKKRRKKKTTVS